MERDEQLRTIGKIMLEYLGYQTLTATNKEEALEAVRRGIERDNPLGHGHSEPVGLRGKRRG